MLWYLELCITLAYSESWHLWDPRYIHNSVKAYSGILRTLCNAHIFKTLPYLELCYIQNYGILLTWGKLRTPQTSDSLRNSGAKNNWYDSGAISEFFSFPRQYVGKKIAEDEAETFVYYIGNGFRIPRHFAKGYDLVF